MVDSRSPSDGEEAVALGDRRLLTILGDAWDEAARRADSKLACRFGCTECCVGPFPINALDAWRLRRGLALLPYDRAERVRARARSAWQEMRSGWDGSDGESFWEQHAAVPCPALDPLSGGCELYEHRPVSCRTFGPPVRFGEVNLPPCRLCFVGASESSVEGARVEIDPAGVEDRILARFDDDSETIVARVLAE